MKRSVNIIISLIAALALVMTTSCSLSIKPPQPSKDYSAVEAEEISVGGLTKYYFSLLDNIEKHAYNNILSSIKTFPQKIEIPVLSEESLNKVYEALLYDNPELFFLNETCTAENYGNVAYFLPKYSMTSSDYSAMIGKCVDVAGEIVSRANEHNFVFEKERIVHDEIIKKCSYTNDSANTYKSSIYGVLVYGSASCEGYAKTAKYLFDLLQIESYVMTGSSYAPTGEMQPHMWNIINLGGDYYHLDLTWDDPVTENGLPMCFYTYFNVSDEVIGKTHFDYENTNECTETDSYFFNYERLNFSRFRSDERATVAEFAAEMIDKGSCGFQLCFETKDLFDEVSRKLFENEEIYELLVKIQELAQTKIATDRVAYVLNEDYNIIEIIVESE